MRSSNAELAHHLRQRQGLLAQRLGCGQGVFHEGCVLLCALVHLRDGLVDLGDAPFPVVQAEDDAALVQWTRIDQLAGMEEEFFEDHFHMLDHFLGLTKLD